MTFLIIICVLIIVFGLAHESNVDDILGLSRTQLASKRKEAFKTSLTILLVFGAILALGIILYKYTNLYKTVQVKTLFGKIKDARRWSSSHYWALFLTFFGSIGTVIGMIGSIRNLVAIGKYSSMSDADYGQLQEKLIEQRKKEQEQIKQAKRAKTGFKIGQFLGTLLFGG